MAGSAGSPQKLIDPDELVEQVAEAIASVEDSRVFEERGEPLLHPLLNAAARNRYREQAKAAIQAYREATSE